MGNHKLSPKSTEIQVSSFRFIDFTHSLHIQGKKVYNKDRLDLLDNNSNLDKLNK